MKKFWIVFCTINNASFTTFDSYEKAEEQAKRLAYEHHNNEYVIMEAVAVTKQPIPAIEIEDLHE